MSKHRRTIRHIVVDGGLAIVLLTIVLGLSLVVDANVVPGAVLAGTVTVGLLEWQLTRHREQVRTYWQHRWVKGASLLAGVALAAGFALLTPDWGLSALAGGLATYLTFLVVITVTQLRGRRP